MNNNTKESQKRVESLSDYSIRELLAVVAIKLSKKFWAGKKPTDKDLVASHNLRSESELIRTMKSPNRKNYSNNSITVDERLAEKVWGWLNIDSEGKRSWSDKKAAEGYELKVGLNNVSNREKWLEKTLKKLPQGTSILDAGAGELQYKKYCKHLHYVSQDFGQYTGEGNTAGLQTGNWDNTLLDIVSDITDIPVESQSFDAVMCIEVFEHIPYPIEAIKEIARVLKPGGKLILTAPFASFVHFAPYYFYNGYSRYFYEKLLPEYGFEIKEIAMDGNFFEVVAQEVRRINDMAIRYAPNSSSPTALDNAVINHLLKRLEKLSNLDTGSDEFAVHDIHILAVKK